jgi:uncharacterized membrane protein (UPF0127 family)
MGAFRVINTMTGQVLAERAGRATDFFGRLRGLIGRRRLEEGEGLHLVPCRAVHTFFMRISIDAVFLDRDDGVLKTVGNIAPWRPRVTHPGTRSVLELPAGRLKRTGTLPGHRLAFERLEPR